jgi:YD repeat-containing protein
MFLSGLCVGQQYQYDDFNRLTNVTYTDGSQIIYTYDDLGNRIDYEVIAVKAFLDIKVMLAGPYSTSAGMMNDGLRSGGYLPVIEPFTAGGFQHKGVEGGGETIANPAVVFSNKSGNSIIDWIVVELRDKDSITNVLHTRSALLQRDGDVVDLDGSSLVGFFGVAADDYYVSVWHRNHLGVATAAPISVSTLATTFPINFTSGAETTYGTDARGTVGAGTMVLYAGDVNGDGKIRYADLFIPPFTFISSDALSVFTSLSGNDQKNGYYTEDTNLDGFVRYSDLFLPPFTFISSDALRIFNILQGNPSGQINKQF